MPGQTFDQEWLSGHESARFPFVESVVAAPGPIPNGFINDLRLFLTGYSDGAIDRRYAHVPAFEKPINPHLFEILSAVYDHFQAPIELVSGFRQAQRWCAG